MKRLLMGLAVLGLVGCGSSMPSFRYPSDNLATFGDPLSGSISVRVARGFDRPGVYYLPHGARLGLLLDVAGWDPAEELKRLEAAKDTVALSVERWRRRPVVAKKRNRHSIRLDSVDSPQNRSLRLSDGDAVSLYDLSF